MPLECQGSTAILMPLTPRFGCHGEWLLTHLQGSIMLAQPRLDLLEQGFNLFTRNGAVATTRIDERGEETQGLGELRHPLGMKLHTDPPASRPRLLEGLDHSVWGCSSRLQAWCQRFHRLVMHGQHRIQIGPIKCPSPSYG